MNKLRRSVHAVVGAVCLLIGAKSYAWFFFIFPIPLSIFGNNDPNAICVGTGAKVGDYLKHPNGSAAKVLEILGPDSFLCGNINYPNKARVEILGADKLPPSGSAYSLTDSPRSTTQAKIELTEDWRQQELSAALKADKTIVAFLLNRTANVGLVISSFDRKDVPDVPQFIRSRVLDLERNPTYIDIKSSEIYEKTISGVQSYQVVLTGTHRQSARAYKFIRAYYVGDKELVQLQFASLDYQIDASLAGIQKIIGSVSGLNSGDPVSTIDDLSRDALDKHAKKCEQLGFNRESEKFNDCLRTLLQ